MFDQPFFRVTADWTGRDGRGRRLTRSGTALSSVSREDAERRAEEAARAAVERALSGEILGRYAYTDRPVVEPVLRRIEPSLPQAGGVVTVNSYGCEVLNAAGLMFVDVDLERPAARPVGWWDRLLGRRPPPPPPAPDPEQLALDRLADLLTEQPGLGVRVYRTAAGLRYLFTQEPHDPSSALSRDLMERLGADSKYVLLCRVQKCFRARLTPKPWRCGTFSMHPGFTHGTDQPNEHYRTWRRKYYDKVANRFATCHLITVLGPDAIHPALAPLVTFHDDATRATSELPLA